MLAADKTCLVIIDIQGKLAELMQDKETVYGNVSRCIRGAEILSLPILWLEQNPVGLGPTIPQIAALLSGKKPIAKMEFSAFKNTAFKNALEQTGCKQIALVGIETHVCVYQTALDLLQAGYEVYVVADGVSSRTKENKEIGLQSMRDAGVKLTATEMFLLELLGSADHPRFKEILQIIK